MYLSNCIFLFNGIFNIVYDWRGVSKLGLGKHWRRLIGWLCFTFYLSCWYSFLLRLPFVLACINNDIHNIHEHILACMGNDMMTYMNTFILILGQLYSCNVLYHVPLIH